jgi:hypothetical protein
MGEMSQEKFAMARAPTPAREMRAQFGIFECVIIHVDSARFDSTPIERLNSRR